MKASIISLTLALSGSVLGVPFKSIGTSVYPSGSGLPTPSETPCDPSLPTPFAPSSTSLALPSGNPSGFPVLGGQPVSINLPRVKRGSAAIPTGVSSLVSTAESALGSLASVAAQKRASLPIPSGLSSLIPEAESALGALASSGARKRDFTLPIPSTPVATPTGISTVVPTGTPSGPPRFTPSFTPVGIPTSTPLGIPSASSGQALPTPTGLSLFGIPLA